MRAATLRDVALWEFRAVSRARWSGVFAIVFAALALSLSYFGMFHTGFSGFVGFVRTSMSLLSVITLVLPLVALAVGSLLFSGEREGHHLILAQPVTRSEVVVGRYLGVGAALAGSTLVAFGAAGFVIAMRAGTEGWLRYLGIVGLSVLLVAISLGIGVLLGITSRDRSRALGGAIIVWGLLVVLYDLVAMGISVMLSGEVVRPLLLSMVMANPVDLVRVLGLLLIGARASLGAPGAVLSATLSDVGGWVLLPLAVGLWLVLPLFVACRSFEQQDF
ncbi:MAG: ABC transporter permease subunit [Limnochordaceae bacterium]|nr:ABC transporter permease subunit [Limnochordaceae bacterium]